MRELRLVRDRRRREPADLRPAGSAGRHRTVIAVVEGLRPLLDLAVEHMLATHGVPFERADLERALSL